MGKLKKCQIGGQYYVRNRWKGINYEPNKNRYAKSSNLEYYLDSGDRLYSNRITLLLNETNVIQEVKSRIKRYFDCAVGTGEGR
uniref:hypothetical protein n=1 Tax=Eshraghiella crossota TaxID=45851 RepID=UPI003FED46DE